MTTDHANAADARAREIAAALDALPAIEETDNGYEGSDYAGGLMIGDYFLDDEDIGIDVREFLLNAPAWLRELLAERERLLMVMTEVAEMGTLEPHERDFGHAAAKMCYMRDKLRAALDADA